MAKKLDGPTPRKKIKRTAVLFRPDADLWAAFRKHAKVSGITYTEYLEWWIRAYLEKV